MSETLWGVIIGAVAAIFGGVVAQMISYGLNKKQERRKQRCDTYESILKLTMINPDLKILDLKEFATVVYENMPRVTMYASKTVRTTLNQIFELQKNLNLSEEEKSKLNSMRFAIGDQIRAELGLKD